VCWFLTKVKKLRRVPDAALAARIEIFDNSERAQPARAFNK